MTVLRHDIIDIIGKLRELGSQCDPATARDLAAGLETAVTALLEETRLTNFARGRAQAQREQDLSRRVVVVDDDRW